MGLFRFTKREKSLFPISKTGKNENEVNALDRKEELLKCLGVKADEKLVGPMVDEIIFLEHQLEELKKLPFIKVHPKQPELQKATPASRLYTQLSAQYNSAMRTLVSLSGGDATAEDSPLREWARKYAHKE